MLTRPPVVAYPEVYFEISRRSKLSISNLERDRHLVILMQLFVEAFPSVCRELDIVRLSDPQEAGGCEKERCGEPHLDSIERELRLLPEGID